MLEHDLLYLTLGRLSSDYYPFEGWSRCSCYRCTISHPCLIHDLQRDFIRQRLHPLPSHLGYSLRIANVSPPSLDSHSSLLPCLLFVFRFLRDDAMPLLALDMEISYKPCCTISVGRYSRISLPLEIMQFLGRLIAFAVPATFDISPWLFHRYVVGSLSMDRLKWLCEEEDSLC